MCALVKSILGDNPLCSGDLSLHLPASSEEVVLKLSAAAVAGIAGTTVGWMEWYWVNIDFVQGGGWFVTGLSGL